MSIYVAKANFKPALNNKSIVEGRFKFHTADYVKNRKPSMMPSKDRTIINIARRFDDFKSLEVQGKFGVSPDYKKESD